MGLFKSLGKIAGTVAGGIIGGPVGAAVGIAGNLLGNSSNKKSNQSAADAATAAQLAGLQGAQGAITDAYGQSRDLINPFIQTGAEANTALAELLGLSGAQPQQAAIQSLQASPLYRSLFRTGEEAILQNASATGGLRGGNTQRSLADFGADTLANVIQRQLQSLGGLYTGGVNAANTGANLATGYGGNMAGLLTGGGTLNANNILTNQAIANNASNQNSQLVSNFLASDTGQGALTSVGNFIKGLF